MPKPYVLVIYYSIHGATERMAQLIGRGIVSCDDIDAKIRTVPKVSPHYGGSPVVSTHGAPFVTKDDLINCSGLILGSPTRFGNMAAPLKYYIDSTIDIWLSGQLVDKPAGAFTSSSTQHGGQESTILSLILPLMHHGALIVGLPNTEKALNSTQFGGSPYGPSHTAGIDNEKPISGDEKTLCVAFGKRIATHAQHYYQTQKKAQ